MSHRLQERSFSADC